MTEIYLARARGVRWTGVLLYVVTAYLWGEQVSGTQTLVDGLVGAMALFVVS